MPIQDEPRWDPLDALTEADRVTFSNPWPQLCPLNVPGPFYTGETDNCWTGRIHAPDHIMYGGTYFSEYVYRQPHDPAAVTAIAMAAFEDPFAGYGYDGDAHWSPQAVRTWWRDRDEVRQSVLATVSVLESEDGSASAEAALGARVYLDYLGGELEADLRRYLFRLDQGHYPVRGERLPEL
ncbi:hypothetical protein KDL01_38250 [Actinospica durhamensis]|uniref:Ferredoxin n=1 Tax=Actinospica durhamensis TaxID=1508375 RepID=A0A941EXK3_9ACTN|nr:hypothetical protein [Actinospica durhamensis]MBR7839168.1 hypothetical protein [Actinospica durhamensis]